MGQDQPIDRLSFELGMINCFAEMVAAGVKRLAISPPLTPGDYERLREASEEIVHRSGIRSHLEKSLLITALQSADFTRGKWSVLYYRDPETLETYLALKRKKARLEESGQYDAAAEREISAEFMRLLSYPEETIGAKLAARTPTDPYMHVTTGEAANPAAADGTAANPAAADGTAANPAAVDDPTPDDMDQNRQPGDE